MIQVEAYRTLNASFAPRFLYRFGRGLGFGAEIVGLVKTMMLCLDRKIQLQLAKVGRPLGFAVAKGWRDYFHPLLDEVDLGYLAVLNRDVFPGSRRFPVLRPVSERILQRASGARYFMFSQLGPLPERLCVPELDLDLSYFAACRELLALAWRPLPEVARQIEIRKQRIGLPPVYLGVHVRRGDKRKEAKPVSLAAYVDALLAHASDSRELFVASDDTSVAPALAEMLPGEWKVWSAQDLESDGYDQTEFNRSSPESRRARTIQFMAEVEILRGASAILGSETSNVPILVKMLRGGVGFENVK